MKKLIFSLLLTSTAIHSNAQLRVNSGGAVTIGTTPTTITKKLTVDGEASIKTTLDILNLNNTGSGWGAQLRFMPNNGTSPNHLIIDNGQNNMIIHTGYNTGSPTKLTVIGDLNVTKTAKVSTSLDILNHNNHGVGWGGFLNFAAIDGSGSNHRMIDNGPSQLYLQLDPNGYVSHSEFLVVSESNIFTGHTAMASHSTYSDKRLKQNINTLNYGLETLMQLNPVSYEWNPAAYTKLTSQKELSKNFQGTQVGFIAQEVEALIPEVVKEVKDGYKSLEYHNLTAVIVQAVKEQQTIIEAQKLAIEELSQQVEQLKNQTTNVDALDLERVFTLEQNRPNPFTNSTSIKYSTPENAQLLITNLEGKTMQSIALYAGENRVIEVSAQELHNGIYIYSIVVEGELKLSKRFVVAK
ncbi:MAG: tail fiber domain-containing protein [Aureispira sp.]|nr:tail fiber domain-containing protein [Aureispira sp.]